MSEHDILEILKWVGVRPDGLITEQMIRDAIIYAYNMWFTDGRN